MVDFPVAEIPTGGGFEGGGRFPPHRPILSEIPRVDAREEEFRLPHRPGIEELPAGPDYGGIIREVFNLRQRVYKLESTLLFAGFGFRQGIVGVGSPNEIPAELGSGGGVFRPHPGEIAELPQVSILERIATFESRLVALEQNVLETLKTLSEKVDSLKTR